MAFHEMFSTFLERCFLKGIKVEKCRHLSCKEKPSWTWLVASGSCVCRASLPAPAPWSLNQKRELRTPRQLELGLVRSRAAVEARDVRKEWRGHDSGPCSPETLRAWPSEVIRFRCHHPATNLPRPLSLQMVMCRQNCVVSSLSLTCDTIF